MTITGAALLEKIAAAGLYGKGGASFSVAKKWQRLATAANPKKYIVCNASEGEPDVKKDFYILQHFPEKVIQGMLLAMDFFGSQEGYINFNKNYYQQLRNKIDPLLAETAKAGRVIHVFEEEPKYIGGETGALLNAIEGKPVQPRTVASPSLQGIFGVPVLLQNVETYYDIALVAAGEYRQQRFFTLAGGKNPGVFALADTLTAAEVLAATENQPDFPYFLQIGGGASGTVIRAEQAATTKVDGCALVKIYPLSLTPLQVIQPWLAFYAQESCGKCAACKNNSQKLWDFVKNLQDSSEIPWQQFPALFRVLRLGSLCGLGKNLPNSIETYANNVLQLNLSGSVSAR
jgi:NADH:ubiquinone oxidoreductase subunit F (NADH-binding)